jgi:NitT/TauT family transport system substrate-binding protein
MAHQDPMLAGLHAGQVDVSGGTVDEMLPYFDPEDPYACFLAFDESTGGDGIVANNDIKSIADLKGKMVAVAKGATSQLLLNVLLKKAGLSEADVETVDLEAEDASNAFLMQEVDAAVTWEPWLTQGKQAPHGHLLADSAETPGLIVDCLNAKDNVFDDRLAEFKALARAWEAAVHYVEAHSREANEIMARNVGGGP